MPQYGNSWIGLAKQKEAKPRHGQERPFLADDKSQNRSEKTHCSRFGLQASIDAPFLLQFTNALSDNFVGLAGIESNVPLNLFVDFPKHLRRGISTNAIGLICRIECCR